MPPPEHTLSADALRQGCDRLGLAVSPAQIQQLMDYVALLQRWNATYNLTAVRDPQAMLTQHLLDCLAVVGPLRRALPAGGRVLDVGSGGGLPGVVLALMLEDVDVTCIDAVGKKAAFITQVAAALQLSRLHAVHGRVENHRGGDYDIITSRAFASLPDFVRLTAPLLGPQGQWAAMKGHAPTEEATQLPAAVELFHVEPLSVPGLAAERCLVWMRPRRQP